MIEIILGALFAFIVFLLFAITGRSAQVKTPARRATTRATLPYIKPDIVQKVLLPPKVKFNKKTQVRTFDKETRDIITQYSSKIN